jgi:glycosyltransferase involved in cell wall biosynthesis
MGAVHFSIDRRLLARLTELLPLKVFVETGTYEGDSVEAATAFFDELHTIELSEELFARAAERFEGSPRVHVHHGSSPDVLGGLSGRLRRRSVLYWLDAHWCGEGSVGGEVECPLLFELEAIGSLSARSVVMIDDARLFLAPPPAPSTPQQWPSFSELLARLSALRSDHELMVIDDIIVFFPPAIGEPLRSFARENAIDWLAELTRGRERREAMEGISARLEGQGEHAQRQADLTREVLEHSRATRAQLDALQREVGELRARRAPLRRRIWLWSRRFRPRPKLGRLEHHGPMPVNVPRRYSDVSPPADPPTVSIVTPSYNYGAFLERTIHSVLDQGYPALEYIVRDGGSDDGTREILERYAPRLANWACEPDSGQANAINSGMAHATGEIMAYLNSDDLLLPGSVSYVASYLLKHPEVDVVYGHRVLIDEDDMEIGRWVLPRHDDALLDWVDFVPQETLFWRRGIWEAAGGRMDEEFRFALDWDLLLRFRDADARIVRLPRFLGAFRVHPAQKTSAQAAELGKAETTRLRSRVLGREPKRPEIRRAMRGYLRRHIVVDKLYRARILRY